jgi:Lar family restriction alleviation protein
MHKDERVTDAMVELKPCPFCGGAAIQCGNNEMNPRHWIMCEACHACPGGDVAQQSEAIAAWNRRAALASAEEEKAVKVKRYRVGEFVGRQPVHCEHGQTDPNNLCPYCEGDADYGDSAPVDVPAVEQEPGDLAAYWVAVADVMSDLDIAIPRLGAGPRQKLADKARETAMVLAQSHPPRFALVASPEAGWIPIETAPISNGSNRFLAYIPGHGASVCYAGAGRFIYGVQNGKRITRATHWRPLPAPPSLSRNSSTEETVGDAITAKGGDHG